MGRRRRTGAHVGETGPERGDARLEVFVRLLHVTMASMDGSETSIAEALGSRDVIGTSAVTSGWRFA